MMSCSSVATPPDQTINQLEGGTPPPPGANAYRPSDILNLTNVAKWNLL